MDASAHHGGVRSYTNTGRNRKDYKQLNLWQSPWEWWHLPDLIKHCKTTILQPLHDTVCQMLEWRWCSTRYERCQDRHPVQKQRRQEQLQQLQRHLPLKHRGQTVCQSPVSTSSTASRMRPPRVLMWLSSRTFYRGDDLLPSPNTAEVQGTAEAPLNCLHRLGGEGKGLESFRKLCQPRHFVLQQRSKSSTIQNRVQNIRKCLQKVNYA